MAASPGRAMQFERVAAGPSDLPRDIAGPTAHPRTAPIPRAADRQRRIAARMPRGGIVNRPARPTAQAGLPRGNRASRRRVDTSGAARTGLRDRSPQRARLDVFQGASGTGRDTSPRHGPAHGSLRRGNRGGAGARPLAAAGILGGARARPAPRSPCHLLRRFALGACLRAGLDSLRFSLNYADAAQFESIARVKPRFFDAMMDNIRAARPARDRVEAERKPGWSVTAGNRGRLGALRAAHLKKDVCGTACESCVAYA
jgi:hypothetical protein